MGGGAPQAFPSPRPRQGGLGTIPPGMPPVEGGSPSTRVRDASSNHGFNWSASISASRASTTHTHSREFVRSVRISNSRFQISNQQTERTKSLEPVSWGIGVSLNQEAMVCRLKATLAYSSPDPPPEADSTPDPSKELPERGDPKRLFEPACQLIQVGLRLHGSHDFMG